MPIEHEIKVVVRLDDELEYEAREMGRAIRIEQGYLTKENGISVRLRKTLESQSGISRYYLQNKCKVEQKRVIEIGTQISEDDFKLLWPAADNKITKTRYCIRGEYNEEFSGHEQWELDFFKDGNKTYFIMAEIEFPESQKYPRSTMPDFIKKNVVYSVPRGDSRFSSRKLGNVRYAAELYRSFN